MKNHKLAAVGVAFTSALLLHTPRMSAQQPAAPADAAAPGGPSAEQREQFRQRMAERLKTAMKASDEEWAIIQPLMEKVQEKQRASGGGGGRFGGGGGFGGPGGPGGGGGGGRRWQRGGEQGNDANNAERPPRGDNPDRGPRGQRGGGGGGGGTPEAQTLRTALDSESTSPGDIKAKLQALRDSRAKAATELEQARADLKKVLNMRQEATLVLIGVLD